MKKNLNLKRSKGYSLIEILIVGAIGLTIVTLGLIGYNYQSGISNVQKEVFYANRLNVCAQDYAKIAINFQTTKFTDIYTTGCFPDEVAKNYNTGSSVWTQSWGNVTFTVESVTSTPNAGDLIAINYPNVPSSQCPLFVASMVAYTYDITVNGTLAALQRSGTAATDVVYQKPRMNQILPLCSAASYVPIKVRFYKQQSGRVTNGKYTSYTGWGFQPGLPEYDATGATVTTNIENDNSNAETQRDNAQKALP